MAEKRKLPLPHLPPELLQLIFSKLPQVHLQPLSLVSRSFLSLSSNCVRKLTFKTSPSDQTLQSLITRFPFVNEIEISLPEIDHALVAVFNSCWNLETLKLCKVPQDLCDPQHPQYPSQHTLHNLSASQGVKKLKTLHLGCFFCDSKSLVVDKVIEFIQLFSSSLVELDLGLHPYWKDMYFERLTLKLPNLRNVNLDGNSRLTGKALATLSSNCVNLEQVSLVECCRLSLEAVSAFLHNTPNLRSVVLPRAFREKMSKASTLEFIEAVKSAPNLRQISLGESLNKGSVVRGIARSSLQFMDLRICHPYLTMAHVSEVLYSCRSLERLVVSPPHGKLATQDMELSQIVKSLPSLKHIYIDSRYSTYVTLFTLIEHCPMLETIRMTIEKGSLVHPFDIPRPTKKNYSIISIEISPRPDKLLMSAIQSYCPNWKIRSPRRLQL